MSDETTDVNQETPSAPVQEQEEVNTKVSDEGAKVDRKVYEKVREDMLAYKAEKKAKDQKVAELEARLAAVETTRDVVKEEPDERTKAKVDILYLVQTDSFVKDNLDLIEEKMSDNPNLTAQSAIKELKSDFFDRMQKETSTPLTEVPLKQINPKGNVTVDRRDIIKNALEGKAENADPQQLAAYNAVMARLK